MNYKQWIVAALVCATTIALPVLGGAMDIRPATGPSSTQTGALGKFDVVDAGVVNVQGAVGIAGSLTMTGSLGITTQGLNIRDSASNTGIFNGSSAGLSTNSINLRGGAADGAAAINASIAAFPTLTAGTDRYLLRFYNDNFSTAQASVTSDGTWIGGYGPVTKAVSKTAPTVVACNGTAASVTSSNGTAAFVFDVGTSCTSESTAVITFPAATTGYICMCTSTTADRVLQQKVIPAASTTVVTIQNIVMSTGANGDFTDGADVACICQGN